MSDLDSHENLSPDARVRRFSHGLKNSLASIMMGIQCAALQAKTHPERLPETFAEMEKAVLKANQLIKDYVNSHPKG